LTTRASGEDGALPGRTQIRRVRERLGAVSADCGDRFPWRKETDPFAILLAEVLLQRTTGPHLAPRFGAILSAVPSPQALATMDPEQLGHIVSGLGLRKRVPVLIRLGKELTTIHRGRVPRSRQHLMRLPGVGRYTAAAVRCFAYAYREPIVDIGVARVLRRAFSIPQAGRINDDDQLWRVARRLMGRRSPRRHNLELLTVAQTFCRSNPACGGCPLSGCCAFARSARRPLPASWVARDASHFGQKAGF
jgi:A/G-specific adenine glycosylase